MQYRLEQEYVLGNRHPERDAIYAQYEKTSAALRTRAKALLDLPYGRHQRARFDLFLGSVEAPLVVFIHGGYWQGHDKSRYSFVAQPLLNMGYSVALPAYPLAPEVTLRTIVIHIISALKVIGQTLDAQGYKPSCTILSGHSAGGHLAACAASHVREWQEYCALLGGLVVFSGVFDLLPILETSMNEALGLTVDEAKRLSPINLEPANIPIGIYVGGDETEAFLAQARGYTSHCSASVADVWQKEVRGRNHYDILKEFLSEKSEIVSGFGLRSSLKSETCHEG